MCSTARGQYYSAVALFVHSSHLARDSLSPVESLLLVHHQSKEATKGKGTRGGKSVSSSKKNAELWSTAQTRTLAVIHALLKLDLAKLWGSDALCPEEDFCKYGFCGLV